MLISEASPHLSPTQLLRNGSHSPSCQTFGYLANRRPGLRLESAEYVRSMNLSSVYLSGELILIDTQTVCRPGILWLAYLVLPVKRHHLVAYLVDVYGLLPIISRCLLSTASARTLVVPPGAYSGCFTALSV